MSLDAMLWALKEAPVSDPTEALILVALADAANSDGTAAFPSRNTIAEWARCSVPTVARRLKALEGRGLIERGDQNLVAILTKIPPDRRPVVWNLRLDKRRINLIGRSPEPNDVSPEPNDVSLGTERRITVDTQTVLNRPEPSLTVQEGKASKRTSQMSPDDVEAFEAWWKVYPRRVSKGSARKAYLTALSKTSHERLLQAAQSFAKAKEAEGTEERYIPHPTTWLNGERWEDERSAGDEFDRLLAKNDVSGVEALVKDRYREPVAFVDLSPGERELARREDFRRWALERRGKIDG